MQSLLQLPTKLMAATLGFLLAPRTLCVLMLALFVWPASSHWLRAPLSQDVSGFSLPVLGPVHEGVTTTEFLHGRRPAPWLSVGMLLSSTAIIGGALVLVWPRVTAIVWGIVLCVYAACFSSVMFNHPELYEALSREDRLLGDLIEVSEATAPPGTTIAIHKEPQNTMGHEVGWLPTGQGFQSAGHRCFWAIAIAGVLLWTTGPVVDRIMALGVWLAPAAVLVAVVCGPRWVADYRLFSAELAESRGEIDLADQLAQRAVEVFPAAAGVRQTAWLLGRIDYQKGVASRNATFFLASQEIGVGEHEAAIDRLTEAAAGAPPGSPVRCWLADARTAELRTQAGAGDLAAAEQSLRAALAAESEQEYYHLLIATIGASREVSDPLVVSRRVDPLVDRLSNRSLRAALHAMIGDAYFQSGEFIEARRRYEISLKEFSLPKKINYRANHGVLGM